MHLSHAPTSSVIVSPGQIWERILSVFFGLGIWIPVRACALTRVYIMTIVLLCSCVWCLFMNGDCDRIFASAPLPPSLIVHGSWLLTCRCLCWCWIHSNWPQSLTTLLVMESVWADRKIKWIQSKYRSLEQWANISSLSSPRREHKLCILLTDATVRRYCIPLWINCEYIYIYV